MDKGLLIVVSGPSGTGKGTVCAKLTDNAADMYLSVSTTTRDQRAGETAGVTYNYISVEQFKELIQSESMLEWAVYNGNYYGTPKACIQDKLNAGINVILEIDVQGALKIKENNPDAVLVFICPPSMEELKNRLVLRGRETEEQIKERIEAAEFELDKAKEYNYVLVNDNLDTCVDDVRAVIRAEAHAIRHNKELIDSIMKS